MAGLDTRCSASERHVKGHSQQHRVAATLGEVTAITPVLHEKAATARFKSSANASATASWMSDLGRCQNPYSFR